MSISYDIFIPTFLDKCKTYDYLNLKPESRTEIIDGYMKRAFNSFGDVCRYDLTSYYNNELREFSTDIEIPEKELYKIIDIITEGMVVQWMKPYVYRQENYENLISTKDFSVHSPSGLITSIGDVYKKVQSDFNSMITNYTYDYADFTRLHL